jgi:hypothetical protein
VGEILADTGIRTILTGARTPCTNSITKQAMGPHTAVQTHAAPRN